VKGAAEAGTDFRGRIVGRESELALLQEFFASERQAFVLTGGPGIGKTTLWEAGLEFAAERGLRVLRARPSDAEAQLSFAGLADLLDEVELTGLAPPQRHALEVALLRVEPAGAAPEPHAIALGLFNALRELAVKEPVVVGVDDIQWLDRSSAEALTFAARRLQGHAVRFLLAKRSEVASALDRAFESQELGHREVGPLSLGAMRRFLFERLELTLPRRTLRRVYEATAGNPLFALEVGRTFAERGAPGIGEDVPVPDAVDDLLGTRVDGLSEPLRRLLLGLALSAELHPAQVTAIAGGDVLEEALSADVVVLDGVRLRPAHPLLAAAARDRSSPVERRDVHRALAEALADPELRARHLALATEHEDPELAATLAAAAAAASARGATEEAVEHAKLALRLSPAGPERVERLLALGEYLLVAGHPQALIDLLSPEVDTLPPGTPRGRAHLLLSVAVMEDDAWAFHVNRALAESEGDPALRASALANKAGVTAVFFATGIAEAEALALEALRLLPDGDPKAERIVLEALGWARIMRGRPIDDLSGRDRVAAAVQHLYQSLERVAGIRLAWRGETREARAAFTRLKSLADERGEALSSVALSLQLCELELRAGEWGAASRVLQEWDQSHDEGFTLTADFARCQALLAAGMGEPGPALEHAMEAIAGVSEERSAWPRLEGLRARGIAALLNHEPEQAAATLRAVWEHTEREGVEDPGAFPVAPDLVEALVEGGELDAATAVTERLSDLAEQQEHPWALATAKRCAALVRLASAAYDEEAAALLEQAAADYERLGLRFDHARSLLNLGRAQRRHRKWAAARSSLEEAAALFDEIGSSGWAEQARSELARIGARRPRPSGELTPSEQRVAELAASGLSNKEIAQELVVTVYTVEAHLKHAYAKLGIRSRSQLAGRLSSQT
jgi:DNA-binding NarL/FixJ family response regulator